MTTDGSVFFCPWCEGVAETMRDAFEHADEHIPEKGDNRPSVMDRFEEREERGDEPLLEAAGADECDDQGGRDDEADQQRDEPDADPTPEPPESPKPEQQGASGGEEPDSPDANPGVDVPETAPHARVSGRKVPEALTELDIWVMWAPEHGKQPIAPWATGHSYRTAWGEGADPQPATDYETVRMFADLPPAELHRQYPFPSDDDVPAVTKPTFYLPHDPPDPPLMMVDFDDVRDPDSGRVSREVMEIVKRLDAYCEVSTSGTGLHVYVRAALPDELGKAILALDGPGDIEFYDHGRMVGATWNHVAGTPATVPERQSVVNDLLAEYETVDLACRRLRYRRSHDDLQRRYRRAAVRPVPPRSRRVTEMYGLEAPPHPAEPVPDQGDDADGTDSGTGSAHTGGSGSDGAGPGLPELDFGGRTNAYFELDIRKVADTGPFQQYRDDTRNPARDEWEGPHPGHGATSSHDNTGPDAADSTNFGIKPREGVWNCFAHGGSRDGNGGALALLGVLKGVVRCGSARRVYDDRVAQLRTCLYAREDYPALEDEDPPAKALRGVAEVQDFGNPDDMSEDDYRIAKKIYDQLEPGDV